MSTRFTPHAANPDAIRNSDAQVTGFTRKALMQQVRADAECRASDEHLRSIMQWMPIIMLATDRDGVITLAEGNGLGNAGLNPSMLIGHALEDVPPDSAEGIGTYQKRALDGEEFAANVEVGGRIWDTRYRPLRDTVGEISGVCVAGLDVTDRVRSERDLAAIRRREAGIAELGRAALAGATLSDVMLGAVTLVARELPDVDVAGVGEITPDGLRRVVAVGVAEDESPLTLSPDPSAYSAMRSIRAGESVVVTDWDNDPRFSRPDWLRLNGVKSSAFIPVINQPGDHVFGFLGAHGRQPRTFPAHELVFLETVANLLGDVIARGQAQDAAAVQAEQFRALAENSPDIVCRLDSDLRIVYINGAVERLSGTPASELIGRTRREAGMEEPQVSAFELAARQVLRAGVERSLDLDVNTVLGPRTFQVRMAPEFGRDGAVRSIVIATNDITERKRADQERQVLYKQLFAQQEQLRDLIARLMSNHQLELEDAVTERLLSDRERQILSLIARGWSNPEIAAELRVSRGTIKNKVSRLLDKLDVSDRTQAATWAVRHGLLDGQQPPSPSQ